LPFSSQRPWKNSNGISMFRYLPRILTRPPSRPPARGSIRPASPGMSPRNACASFSSRKRVFTRSKSRSGIWLSFPCKASSRTRPFQDWILVSCRNLMIYLDPTLQKKMIPVFHYTLNTGGVLLLGTSETIGEFTDLFGPIDSKWKVYQRKEGFSSGIVDYSRGVATETTEGSGLTPVKQCRRKPISRPWPKKRYWTDTPLPVFWSMTNTRFCILSAGRKNTWCRPRASPVSIY
jgi:hypothetical protein